MKTFTIRLMVALVAILGFACRTNNGDIGVFYGQWQLSSLRVNDDPACPMLDFSMRFQNNIVEITQVLDHHDAICTFGHWSRHDDSLLLDFSMNIDHADVLPLAPAPLIGMDQPLMSMQILRETSRLLVLQYKPDPSLTYTYHFEKVN